MPIFSNLPSLTLNVDNGGNTNTAVTYADGSYYIATGGQPDSPEMQDSNNGAILQNASPTPGLDFRSLFTDAQGQVFARGYDDNNLYVQTSFSNFSPYLALQGSLDPQQKVVLDQNLGMYIGLNGTQVQEWTSDGTLSSTVDLNGFTPDDTNSIAAYNGKWYAVDGSNNIDEIDPSTGNVIASQANPSSNHYSMSIANNILFLDDDSGNYLGYGLYPNDQAQTTSLTLAGVTDGTAGSQSVATVTAKDQFGNIASNYSGTVHFTSSDPQASIPLDATLTNGVGTFNVALDTAGAQSLTATDTVDATITGTQAGIAVTPAAASHFAVTGMTPANAGTPESATVTALDAYGNVATGYAGSVHFTSSDNHAVLPSDATLTSGTGIFSVTLLSSGSQSLIVTDTVDPTLAGSESAEITAIPASSGGGSGSPISTAPTPGSDDLTGTSSNDTIAGQTGDDTISGLGGNDLILGDQGRDLITVGDGANTVVGGMDQDTITSGDGDNLILGNLGDDSITVGRGNDTAVGGMGNDVITAVGGRGRDVFYAGQGSDTITTGDGDSTVVGGLDSTDGADLIRTGQGNDLIFGNGGDDTVSSGAGLDSIAAGAGNDLVLGNEGNDLLLGNMGADTLLGGAGSDTLAGGQGDDTLIGGTGNDLMFGNAGSNTFVFSLGETDFMSGVGTGDTVGDFKGGTDSLHFASGPAGTTSNFGTASTTSTDFASIQALAQQLISGGETYAFVGDGADGFLFTSAGGQAGSITDALKLAGVTTLQAHDVT